MYHAIENTANQNVGKPYHIVPSHHVLRVSLIDYVGHCIAYGMA